MSSAFLYLAIVAVWGIVLVPMWLRRDSDGDGRRRLFGRRRTSADDTHDDDLADAADDLLDQGAETETMVDEAQRARRATEPAPAAPVSPPVPPVLPRRDSRSASPSRLRPRIIARRRRRTTGLTCLLIGTLVLAATRLIPWWTAALPVVLLVGHLALLRAAARIDAEQARAAAHHRAVLARRRAAARHTEETTPETTMDAGIETTSTTPSAEIIDISARALQEPYDQYADAEQRAVND